MRHHRDVIGVLNAGVASHLPQLVEGALPAGSLLAMLFNRSRIEVAEASNYQEETRSFLDGLTASVCEFAVDEGARRIRFRGELVLDGKNFELFHALLPAFREGKAQAADVQFIRAPDLASKLGFADPSLRQQVTRLRNTLTEQLAVNEGLPFDVDDVIENRVGRGYRINPQLRELSLGDLLQKI